MEPRTDVGPGEGNRRRKNGEENVPHVSGRTSVRVAKECAEQQGNAATRQNKRRTGERGGAGETDGRVVISPLPFHTAARKKPRSMSEYFPRWLRMHVTRSRK